MKPGMRWGLWLASVLALMSLAADHARADATGHTHASRAEHAATPPPGYTETLRAALTQYDQDNWQEAKALFEKAHAMFPNARTLRGLGLVAYAARRYAQAREYLLAAIAHEVRPLTREHSSAARAVVDQCETYLGHFRVKLTPDNATLSVDGRAVTLDETDGLLRLDPGEHELVARAAGAPDVVRRLSVSGGQEGEIEIDVTPTLATKPTSVDDAPSPALSETVAREPASDGAQPRVWTWVALGSAAAFGGAALGLQMSAVSERDDISKQCSRMPGGGCELAERDALVEGSGIGTKTTLASIGLGLSVASAVGAVVLFFVEGSTQEEREHTHQRGGVRLSLSPTGVVVHGAM